jgi:hypothetical protein
MRIGGAHSSRAAALVVILAPLLVALNAVVASPALASKAAAAAVPAATWSTGTTRHPPKPRCAGQHEVPLLGGGTVCVHGDDTAARFHMSRDEARRSVRTARSAAGNDSAATVTDPSTGTIHCYGNGADGARVQAIYVHYAGGVDQGSAVDAGIAADAAAADGVFDSSAGQSGSNRHIRWLTTAGCALNILHVQLPSGADASFTATINALRALGAEYQRPDRHYVMWAQAAAVCGIGTSFNDDTASSEANQSNLNAGYARVDLACWNFFTVSHELTHTLGAVNTTSPHHTNYGHCYDESEVMCYADGAGSVMQQVCPLTNENFLDCNHDDYFNAGTTVTGYLSTHWNTANSPFLSSLDGSTSVITANGTLHALTPTRLLDSRPGHPAIISGLGPLYGAGSILVAGLAGVPSSHAAAAVLNVTVTGATAPGYLSVFPYNNTETPPNASNLNFGPGQTVPNLVVVPLGGAGSNYPGFVSLFASGSGGPNVIIDVLGWFADSSGVGIPGGHYNAIAPARDLDTRTGVGHVGAVGPGQSINLKVTNVNGVPADHVSAVILNVTSTGVTAPSYVTVWPTGVTKPTASNLNLSPGVTAPNLVLARVGNNGSVSLFNAAGSTDLIADVAGWFDDGSVEGGAQFHPLNPTRALDTRTTTGGHPGALGNGASLTLPLAGSLAGVPSDASAVVMNTTVTSPTSASYLTVWPAGTARPTASNLNFVAGDTRPNLVFATLGGGGAGIFNKAGSTQVIADVAGWFGPS